MNFKKLDEFMEKMPERGFPSAELSVCVKGKNVCRTSVGYADSARKRACSPSDLYYLFSATKVVTCLAALRLVEEGKLRLDDRLSDYIPAFSKMKIKKKDGTLVDAENPITIEQLFAMTSGIGYDIDTPEIRAAAARNAGTYEIVSAMAKTPLYFEPGTHYMYSLSHDVLAAVIEVVTGMRYSEYLKKIFFDPLEIVDMGFRPNDEQKKRFQTMYVYKNGTAKPIEVESKNAYILSDNYESGGAGLFGSVDEYMKIISAISCGGAAPSGARLLRPETIRMCTVNRLCDDALEDFVHGKYYGYGWGLCGRVHVNPTVSFSRSPAGEFGWDGAAGAFAMIDTANEVAMFFSTNVRLAVYLQVLMHPELRNVLYECMEEI